MADRLLPPVRLRRLLTVAAVAAALAGGALVAPPQSATAATVDHFVDCSRKSNGGGSLIAPWNSTAAVASHGGFTAGDRILLKRGTTCKGQLTLLGSGTKAAPIVLGAYGKGAKPTVAGGGTYNNTGTVQLINQQYWTIQDLHITNKTKSASTKTYRSGLLLQSDNGGVLHGLVAQRLTVDSVVSNPGNGNTRAYGGISVLTFGTRVDSGFSGVRILNNRVSNVARTGIVESNAQYPKSHDSGSRIAGNTVNHARGDGIVMIGVKGGRIDHNTVANAADLGTCSHCGRYGGPSTASAGIWPSNAQNIVIERNEVYGTHKAGGDGEGFDIDRSAKNVVMQYNYAHDNQGGGVLVCGARDSTIRFNVFENNGTGVLSFYGKAPATNTNFYNNTVYASKSSKAKIVRTFGGFRGSKISFKNNLIYSYGPGTYQWPTKSVSTAANTLIGYHGSGRPHDARTSWSNPHLKAPGTGKNGFGSLKGYRLKSTKGAQTGVAIPKSVKVDIFGKKVNPKHPVRGASSGS